MEKIELHPEPLTAAGFERYGDVVEVSENNRIIPINYGLTERHHDLAQVDVSDGEGVAQISLFRTQAVSLPFQIKVMERHPLGSQCFMGLHGQQYLVVVAAAGEFDVRNIRAFLATADQGVNYHKGTWHHYCLSLDAGNDFMVVDRGGEGDNCDEQFVPSDTEIWITSS